MSTIASPQGSSASGQGSPTPSPYTEERRTALEHHFQPAFGLASSRLGKDRIRLPLHLPRPPEAIRDAHDGRFIRDWWTRANDQVSCPTATWVDSQGARHVHVLGESVYSFDAFGYVSAWRWREAGPGRWALVPNTNATFAPMPWRWSWMRGWADGVAAEVLQRARERGANVSQEMAAQYAGWVMKHFRALIGSVTDVTMMRQRVGAELFQDFRALMMAETCRGDRGYNAPVLRVPDYNKGRYEETERVKLVAEQPALEWLFVALLVMPGFPGIGEPTARMKAYLSAHGISHRGWRVICNSKYPVLRPIESLKGSGVPATQIDYLRMIDKMGWRDAPDETFMNRLVSTLKVNTWPAHDLNNDFSFVPRTLKRMVEWYEKGNESMRAAIVEHLPLLISWLDAEGAEKFEALAVHPAWAGTLKCALAWDGRRKALNGSDAANWDVPKESIVIGRFEACFIGSAVDLYEEGNLMRHCAFDYLEKCKNRFALIASIRYATNHQRVATVMFSRAADGSLIRQVKGFANREVGKDVETAANILGGLLEKLLATG